MGKSENVKLVRITEDKINLLRNLLSLYLYDLSEFADDLKVNKVGSFEYEGLDYYFKEEALDSFLIYYKEEVAGFVLFNSGNYVMGEADYNIHELFVLKSFRKKGIATVVVEELLENYKGRYNIVQLGKNKTAIKFWKMFYEKYNIAYEEKIEEVDGMECYIQTFKNGKA